MTQAHYQTLFAYSWHTAQKLLDQAAQLDEAARHAHPGVGHGAIHDLFFHLLASFQGWRVALETGQQPPRLQPAGYETLDAMRAALAQEYDAMQRWLAGQDDAAIAGQVTLTTARGHTATFPLWRILQHLVLHAMQHHTELANLLTLQGHSPGDIDLLFYQG